ncbi:hypothetical protein V1478_017199 [Vespula squamosa]|uniref:Uncharacterized protein n=1 Tax=Vespula squamosa TaxID=30214 RepID=A0ABD1ZYS1_VESSQ
MYNISLLLINGRAKQGHVITHNIVETCVRRKLDAKLYALQIRSTSFLSRLSQTFPPFEGASFLNSLTSRTNDKAINDNGVFHKNVQVRDQNYIVKSYELRFETRPWCERALTQESLSARAMELADGASDGADDGAGGEGRRWSEVVGLGGRLTHKGGAR